MTSSVQSTPANSGNKLTTGTNKLQLKTEDFIKMMVTQLQQQDPMEPAKNEELLAQMSQIGQLQSSETLQESLKGMVKQNQMGAAASLIGKSVKGMDADKNSVEGQVMSVSVADDAVNLELDNGKSIALANVTTISPSATGTTTTPPTTTGT